jgi:nucleoside-diphosphate-sugar epimerase
MSRVLVTGATGFIGRRLVAALQARGDHVRCLVHGTSQLEPLEQLDLELMYGDVTASETLPATIANVDVVYHLAGLTKAKSLAEYCQVNETGVRNVVDACARRITPPVMILVSSLAAAGPMTDRQRLRTESDSVQPVSRYGKSKRAGELATESRAGDLPITVVRPPIVLGPGDRTSLDLFRTIRRVRSFVVVGLGRRLSVVYVDDLAAALISAAGRGERLPAPTQAENGTASGSSNSGCGHYFVAADEHPRFSELARMIARSINRPYAWAIPLPLASLWVIGGIGEFIGKITRRARYLNLDRAHELTAGHWTCSSEKARRDLGFVPGAPLLQRIEQTAQWYKDHGWL